MKKCLPIQKRQALLFCCYAEMQGGYSVRPRLPHYGGLWQRIRRRRRSAGYAIRPTGQAHGDTLAAEGHTAFQQRFAAGMERRAPGRAARSSSMTAAFTPAPIAPRGRPARPAGAAARPAGNALAAAPQHRRSSAPCRCRVPPRRGRWRTDRGNVDAAMQRDGRTAAGVQQRAHGGQIKRTLRRQCADDEAHPPRHLRSVSIWRQSSSSSSRVYRKSPRPRAHQAAHGAGPISRP